MIRRVLFLLCLIASIPFLKRFCYHQTDGFSFHKILSSLTFHNEWEVKQSDLNQEELNALFDQPYYYLAKGAQSYVFISEDQKTVIKFFRLHHLLSPFWSRCLIFPPALEALRLKKITDKQTELSKDFESYVIAHNLLKEETGLLFLHLNKTKNLKKTVTIYDKLQIAHKIPLDEMEFVVQKRATLVYPSIDQMMKEEGLESTKEALSSLVKLLVTRSEKGIFDKDPDLNTNFGFLAKIPLQIDIGRFRFRQSHPTTQEIKDEIIRITDNLRQWLDATYPPLSVHLMHEIDLLFSQKESVYQAEKIETPLTLALSQPYHYFGRGGQSSVFFSEDGNYVFKCLKEKPLSHKCREKAYLSCELAMKNAPLETGTLWVSSIPSPLFSHDIPIDKSLGFILQKRAEPIPQRIERLIATLQEEKAKETIRALFTLHLTLFKKGIYNRDINFKSNCGFIDESPVLFDIGRLIPVSATYDFERYRKQLKKKTQKFRIYLMNHYPQLLLEFDQNLEAFLQIVIP